MKRLLLLVAILAAGCGYQIPWAGASYSGPTNPQPNQDKAFHIVWHDVYDLEGDGPPILWRFGDRCNTDPNAPNTFKDPGGSGCLFGYYDPYAIDDTANLVTVEWNGNFSAYETFAHELCHVYVYYTTGDPDNDHVSPCFSIDGVAYTPDHVAPGSLVDLADQALKLVGL